jgi:hypothetical protein
MYTASMRGVQAASPSIYDLLEEHLLQIMVPTLICVDREDLVRFRSARHAEADHQRQEDRTSHSGLHEPLHEDRKFSGANPTSAAIRVYGYCSPSF